MTILFIHTYYKDRGGEDIVVEKEQELMQDAGCSVESLNFSNKTFTFLKFLFAPFNPISFYKVYKKIRLTKPDIVHLHNWSFAASPSVIWAVRINKIPLVHTLHNFRIICPSATLSYNQKVYTDSIQSYFPWKAIRRRVYKNSLFSTFWMTVCTRLHHLIGTWKKVDCYIALTNQTKFIFENSYLVLPASRIIAKPNFVTARTTPFGVENRGNHFLYVGRLSEEKGISTLLKAFVNTHHKIQIIGDGPMRSLVESYASDHKNIIYLGYKVKDEIETALARCTALVFPSICIETFGMSIIEAFSTGTPVIATNIGSAIDLVQDGFNGLHFCAGDEEDLKNKLAAWSMLDNTQKEVFYFNSFLTYKKNYTASSNSQQLYSIYSSIKKK
ncbi:MAG: glycosyltransferase family 1 protein [Sphingobacteriales bacterium]|nr:MAG: glycosyltransferase family 1 protein [Sphingobacteriales bacterium]